VIMTDVPENCPSCGAGTNPAMLTCEWCGQAVVQFESLADELKAIQELARSAQKLAGKSGSLSSMMDAMTQGAGGGGGDRLAAFWKEAYIPRTLEAQVQLFVQVTGQIETSGNVNRAMNARVASKNKMLSAVAIRIIAKMDEVHGADPEAQPKIAMIKGQLADIKKADRKGKMKVVAQFASMFLVLGGFMAYQFHSLGDTVDEINEQAEVQQVEEKAAEDLDELKAECRGQQSGACDDACRLEACTALCESHSMQWACDTRDML